MKGACELCKKPIKDNNGLMAYLVSETGRTTFNCCGKCGEKLMKIINSLREDKSNGET